MGNKTTAATAGGGAGISLAIITIAGQFGLELEPEAAVAIGGIITYLFTYFKKVKEK